MQCEVLELDLLEILYILKYLTRRIRGTNEIGMADPGRRVPGQGRQLVGLDGSVSENTIQGILLPQLLVHKIITHNFSSARRGLKASEGQPVLHKKTRWQV